MLESGKWATVVYPRRSKAYSISLHYANECRELGKANGGKRGADLRPFVAVAEDCSHLIHSSSERQDFYLEDPTRRPPAWQPLIAHINSDSHMCPESHSYGNAVVTGYTSPISPIYTPSTATSRQEVLPAWGSTIPQKLLKVSSFHGQGKAYSHHHQAYSTFLAKQWFIPQHF